MIREYRNHWLSPLMFLGASFILHLFWENLQAPLYVGFTSYRAHFWICFKATGGDLLFMLILYAALAVIHRSPFWIADRSAYEHPATWTIVPFIGVLLAVGFELWAVYVDHRWQYAAMPMIPVLGIGLFPVLQMIVIPLVAITISARFVPRS
ncbi:MAG TPA: hypothetical protein DEB30_01100 [Candidatus Peribacter riflensis]|uniref:Uncharacterized protein n=1 Tax=Candidatus Peribacter riflensis TaxID=1735162 RepID=A0A0S1SIF0_9BACT|nr:MAG: hypothetical protein PeribacterA2_1110 [Candidatus Peribacter riflensis]OGJ77920.1 MAG: hypothetical protein A2398_01335 [Candidatus Peribacteria bacterium RIFOXYB1_FULL_57_12]OGJ79749.1 MAG: hypothetical protein A2412_02785 [Candidatus Peribacteria bacterium RIFOXYC1_FULL_58_8]ALM11568.1 MAG: hypothetical protein PeribacterB2_1112 [Candidatus Peribacter riflensis]ALM12670.1 MAG: hypothetical protein PeribacterC2_1111 [Candidatus Peribacter riflensis]